jgi:hypothetical protein
MSDAVPNELLGYMAALVAIVCFGSNFVFVKGVMLGDGVFFQFVMCASIWVKSIPVLLAVGAFPASTTEFATAMLGGFLWCFGNMLCGPIIRLIGLGMGLLIWGSTNMLTGWASGTFGLFGLTAEAIKHPWLNYAGVILAVIGLAFYLQVQPNENSESVERKDPEQNEGYGAVSSVDYSPLVVTGHTTLSTQEPVQKATENRTEDDPFLKLGTSQRRLLGFSLALLAGTFFGCSFDPSQWVIDAEDPSSRESTLIFVFPQFCGILLSSISFFALYCVVKIAYLKQQPYVHASILIPGMCSGILCKFPCASLCLNATV